MSRYELLKLDYPKEQFQICFSQDNQFVRSISVVLTDTDSFKIDGKLVKLSQRVKWYRKENPFVNDCSYIFPNKNLAIWDNDNGVVEVSIYSNLEKPLYERTLDNLQTYNTPPLKLLLPKELYLTPYVGLNMLEFGYNPEKVHQILGSPLHVGKRLTGAFGKGAYFEDYNNLFLRYDDSALTQIQFYNIPNIYYDKINLASRKILSILEEKYNIVPQGSYSVIPELGITLGKDELFIYSERIKDLWLNSKRPITSW